MKRTPTILFCLVAILTGLPLAQTDRELTPAERKEFVDYHNRARAEVNVEPVTWSDRLAEGAQSWADQLARRGLLQHSSGSGYGENLAIHSSVLGGAALWYAEKPDYVPGSEIPGNFGTFKAGHYTQMVWRDTREIGAGKARIQAGRYRGQFVIVCRYNPPGNYLGEPAY